MCAAQNSAEDRLARGMRAAQRGQYAQAETEFRAALASAPTNAEAKFGLATVLATNGRLHDAIALFRDIIQTKPSHLAAWLNLGKALLHVGQHRASEEAFRAVLKTKPDLATALHGLGCALQYQAQPAEAEIQFRKALQFQPKDPGLWMNLGTVLKQQRKLNDALEAYRKTTQLKPDMHQGWSAFGHALLELGASKEAEAAFRRALQLAPQAVEASIGLGDALCHQQREDAALESYFKAIALDPKSQNAHTKAEALLLRMAGATGEPSLFSRLLGDHIYACPADSKSGALALIAAYPYPAAPAIDHTRAMLEQFDPERLYPDAWWKEQLSPPGFAANGDDKIFRGIASAIYSWSPPCREAIEAVARFAGEAILHSFGAGTGYWEWLLKHHFGTRVRAGDRILRHRFIEMAVEDYATATVDAGEVVFLAWIPQGADAVMHLLRQMRPEQKLVIVGQGPDDAGKARICATEEVFRYLEALFEPAGKIPLGYYSYISDDVRLYSRRR